MWRLVALALLAYPAAAHEWYTGQLSPQGMSCCGGNDCAPVPYEGVRHLGGEEWEVTIIPGTHPMLPVEDSEVCYTPTNGRPYCYTKRGVGSAPLTFRYHGNPGLSLDGNAHACITGADIKPRNVRCLFIGGLM